MIGGDRQVDRPADVGDDVEVRERRLDHHHVRALGDVEGDLGQGFAPVAAVLLVAGPVTTLGDGDVDCLAERAVEGRGVLGGIGEDRRVDVAVGVEGTADGFDLAVHHPARGHHVGTGPGLGERHAPVELDGGVVVDLPVGPEHPAVPAQRVLVEAQVGHEHQLVAEGGAQLGERNLDDPVRIPGARAVLVLRHRHAEEHEGGDAEVGEAQGLFDERVDRVLALAGQRRDGGGPLEPLTHEQRCDEVVDRQPRLSHEPAQCRCPAQTAGSVGGEAHPPSLRCGPLTLLWWVPGGPRGRRRGRRPTARAR